MMIMIVDDDHEDREFFCEALNEIDPDIKCWTAGNGKEALQLLAREIVLPPDYIFLDINMPLMNGEETLVELKKNTTLREVPVIMYSTTTDSNEIKNYYALGAFDFLIKPHSFNDLVEALTSIIISTKKPVR